MKNAAITIVTPSFNQGRFIEDTIQSVVGQMYPGLEYIIIDGGSHDCTVNIIKNHESDIDYWVSEPDRGQAHAINKGFNKGTANILAWLNSDDMYLPGTLSFVADNLDTEKAEILSGNSLRFDEKQVVMWGSDVRKEAATFDLEYVDYIMQPSSFWTKKAWDLVGHLDENLHYGFDWEWFIRAKRKGVTFKFVDKYLSLYRIHEEHKSGNKENAAKRRKELLHIYNLMHQDPEIQIIADKSKNYEKNIRQMQYYLKKFRLLRYERYIFSMLYPSLFLKHPYNKVMNVMKMV